MKSLRCHSLSGIDDLRVEDVTRPQPGPNEVLIEVAAAGVNFPDVLMVQGKYQAKAELPFTPGFELAGVVAATGKGVSHVKAGDRVLAIVDQGAFAEQCVASAERVMPLPPDADLERAAAMMFTYGTSYHALKDRAGLKKGDTLLVLGAAGGVGLAAVELGKLMGARVIAAASNAEKLAVCREHGADETIDYSKEDLREPVKRITGGEGVDVCYDPVGGAYTEPALRSLAWKGRLLVVGFAAGDIPRIALNLPLLKGSSIVGVFWGAFLRNEPELARANARQLLDWLAAGAIRPHISKRFALAQATEALREVAERRATGKVIVVPR
jgi:NADPH2:quinone reductase